MKKRLQTRAVSGVGWAAMALLHGVNGIGMVWAQAPANAVPVVIQDGHAASALVLDKLLLSPAQRSALEAARKVAVTRTSESEPRALPGTTATSTLPEALVVSGTVTRAGNRSTVWVNNQPLYGSGIENPVRALAKRMDAQQPGSKDLLLKAKPGQTVDTASRITIDALPRGAIRIIPAKGSAIDRTATPEEP